MISDASAMPEDCSDFATVKPGTAGRPFTLFVHKATIENDRHAELTWGLRMPEWRPG